MKILRSSFPFLLHSQSAYPPILNFLQEKEEETQETSAAEEQTEEESESSESQNGESDAADETPAGKKFALMRKAKADAEANAQNERDARLIAEARANAFEEAMAKLNPQQQKALDTEEIKVHPDDLATVEKSLRKMGLDPSALKQNAALAQQMQQLVFNQNLNDAVSNLSTKYKDSVPFDKAKVVAYVHENKLLASLNAPLERVLEIAHKEMNEDALAEWRYSQRKKSQKITPKISDTGTGKKEIRDEKPSDARGWRQKALEIAGAGDL